METDALGVVDGPRVGLAKLRLEVREQLGQRADEGLEPEHEVVHACTRHAHQGQGESGSKK